MGCRYSRGNLEISRWVGCFFLSIFSPPAIRYLLVGFFPSRSFHPFSSRILSLSLFLFLSLFLSLCLSFSVSLSLLHARPYSVSAVYLSLYYCYLVCERPPKNGSRPEMRRRTNLMKFQYTFNFDIHRD